MLLLLRAELQESGYGTHQLGGLGRWEGRGVRRGWRDTEEDGRGSSLLVEVSLKSHDKVKFIYCL